MPARPPARTGDRVDPRCRGRSPECGRRPKSRQVCPWVLTRPAQYHESRCQKTAPWLPSDAPGGAPTCPLTARFSRAADIPVASQPCQAGVGNRDVPLPDLSRHPAASATLGILGPRSRGDRSSFDSIGTDNGPASILIVVATKVEHVEQIPDGRHVRRHVGIGAVHLRIGEIVAAAAGQRLQAPIALDKLND